MEGEWIVTAGVPARLPLLAGMDARSLESTDIFVQAFADTDKGLNVG